MAIQKTYASSDHMQIIIAAEMNDITDPVTGQYAQLKQLIDNERSLNPTTFFLFGGGSIGPSALSSLDNGSHIIDLLNSLEPDAMGVAKREFSFNVDELSLRSYEAAFPLVASNITDIRINDVPDGLVKTALIERNNIKLGFISVVNQRLIHEYLLSDIEVLDEMESIKVLATALRKAGAAIIVVHYFNSFTNIDNLLSERVVDYAFISNTRLSEETKVMLSSKNQIMLLDRPGIALVADFSLSKDFPLRSIRTVELNEIPADLLIENQVNSYLIRLNRLLDDNIAYWVNDHSTLENDVRTKENTFANFVADAMRTFGQADIALINAGSIRGARLYKNGEHITRRTIASELPFRSTLSVISVSGQQVLEALEVGFAGLDLLKGTFPQVSGMQIKFDSSAAAGERVISVKVNGKDIDKKQQYLLATTNYLASGGDDYTPLMKGKKQSKFELEKTILISDLVLQTLGGSGTLDCKLEGRLINVAATE